MPFKAIGSPVIMPHRVVGVKDFSSVTAPWWWFTSFIVYIFYCSWSSMVVGLEELENISSNKGDEKKTN